MRTPNIVVIGGGSGQSNLLRGLKNQDAALTAVVAMSDDGGGSGRLRDEIGMLPPGDIRNCILALSQCEPAMQTIMAHRFQEGSLRGQNLGNLVLAALSEIHGSFEDAISQISTILAVRGRVLPVTTEDVRLCAWLKNGQKVCGESKIAQASLEQHSPVARIEMIPPRVDPFFAVLEAIGEADLVLLGPGSLYTSLIPPLLTQGVCEAIRTRAVPVVYIANIMTEKGETSGCTLFDHVQAIERHSGGLVTHVLANVRPLPDSVLERYRQENQTLLYPDRSQCDKIQNLGIKTLKAGLSAIVDDCIVHDGQDTAAKIMRSFFNCQIMG